MAVTDGHLWAAAEISAAGAQAMVRLGCVGGDWTVTALVLIADGIDSQTLKQVSVGRLPVLLRTDASLETTLLNAQPPEGAELTEMIARTLAALDEVQPVEPQPADRNRLRRPDGTNPDGHARDVAAAYREAVRLGKAPGPAIATEAHVPVATARGWIQEARRRGHLAKGRKGRAGG